MTLTNLTIKYDITSLTGVDLLGGSMSISDLLKVKGSILIPDEFKEVYRLVAERLKYLYENYFIYKEENYSTPLAMYEDLQSNGRAILNETLKDFSIDIYVNPLSYYVRTVLLTLLDDLPKRLMDVAAVHKFDKEYLINNYFPEHGEDD